MIIINYLIACTRTTHIVSGKTPAVNGDQHLPILFLTLKTLIFKFSSGSQGDTHNRARGPSAPAGKTTPGPSPAPGLGILAHPLALLWVPHGPPTSPLPLAHAAALGNRPGLGVGTPLLPGLRGGGSFAGLAQGWSSSAGLDPKGNGRIFVCYLPLAR